MTCYLFEFNRSWFSAFKELKGNSGFLPLLLDCITPQMIARFFIQLKSLFHGTGYLDSKLQLTFLVYSDF